MDKPKRPKTGGRSKGTPNKVTGEIKEMVLTALSEAGGVEYLKQKAESHPNAFMTLVGKVLPLQINGAGANGEHLLFTHLTRKVVDGTNDTNA